VKAKAAARENDLQRQVDHLKQALGESDGRLASANLRIQELVTERERRKAADEARNDYPRSTVSAESVKMLAGAPSNHTRRNDLLIADAVKDFYNGRVHAAKFKLEEIVMNDPTNVVACEVLVIVLRGVMEAEAAKRTAERTAGGR
jgi:predicted Zn-dependent protease